MNDLGNVFQNNKIISYNVYTGLTNTNDIMTLYNLYWITDVMLKCNDRIDALKEVYTTNTTNTNLNPLSGLINFTTNNINPYTRETLTLNYLKLNVNTNHLLINASNQLEINSSFF
jgi:hypothetical protein